MYTEKLDYTDSAYGSKFQESNLNYGLQNSKVAKFAIFLGILPRVNILTFELCGQHGGQ